MSSDHESNAEQRTEPIQFPLYVRVLAVMHVLSLVLGPVGFVLLGGIARFLWVRHGLDGWVIGFSVGGISWLLACVLFRRWFVWWGRRNWPEPEPLDSSPGSNNTQMPPRYDDAHSPPTPTGPTQ